MRKISIIIALSLVVMLFAQPAFAAVDFSSLDIDVPQEFIDMIDRADIDKLAERVKEELEVVKNMSDEELYEYTKEFCEKYNVELNDDQIRSVSEYLRKATDFDLDKIKSEIESIKSKISTMGKVINFFKSVGEKASEFFSAVANVIKNAAESIKNFFCNSLTYILIPVFLAE